MNTNSAVAVFLMVLLTGCSQNNSTATPVATPAVDQTAQAVAVPESVQAAATEATQAAQAATAQVQTVVQNAADAIKESVNQGDIQKQIDYLVAQAKNFIGEEKYDQVAEIANHILANLDQNSAQAKDLLQSAQAHVQDKAKAMAADAQNALGSFMKK